MRAIILAGGPSGTGAGMQHALPRPFWPVLMRPVMIQSLQRMVEGGIRIVTVCANGRTGEYTDRLSREKLDLDALMFREDTLPRGPAGCVKDAADTLSDEPFLIADGACWFSDNIKTMFEHHRRLGNALTVFCRPGTSTPSGLYVCERFVVDIIPTVGYFDIKQQLIPRLLERGIKVGAVPLSNPSGEIINATTYLALHHHTLIEATKHGNDTWLNNFRKHSSRVYTANDAHIDTTARLYGPIVIGHGARIEKHAVIVGPTTVGQDAVVEHHAVVIECAVWAGAHIGASTMAEQSIIAPSTQNVQKQAPQTYRQVAHWRGHTNRSLHPETLLRQPVKQEYLS